MNRPAPDLAPQRERPPELDTDDGSHLRAPAGVEHHAQDGVDAERGVPETSRFVSLDHRLTTTEDRVIVGIMDPHERAVSVWDRVAGLLRRKDLAVEVIEAEIRLAQREVLLDAAQLVSSLDPIQAARELRARADRAIRAE